MLRERGRKYVGLPEFAQAGERLLSQLALEQERGTVTNVPDERTIRYYLAEGLIQPPEEKQGTASVFGYMNLLQLLAVKKLQAEHLPIRKIRDLVARKSERELETLLGVGGTSGKKSRENEAQKYLESLLASPIDYRIEAPRKPRQMQSSAAPYPGGGETRSWQRVEIEPGLELHIRSDYLAPRTSARLRSLADRIRAAINRYYSGKEKEP